MEVEEVERAAERASLEEAVVWADMAWPEVGRAGKVE